MMLLPTLSWMFYLRALTSALQSLVQRGCIVERGRIVVHGVVVERGCIVGFSFGLETLQ